MASFFTLLTTTLEFSLPLHCVVLSFSINLIFLSFSLEVTISSSSISARFPPKPSILFPLWRLWSWRPDVKPQPQDGGTSLPSQQNRALPCAYLLFSLTIFIPLPALFLLLYVSASWKFRKISLPCGLVFLPLQKHRTYWSLEGIPSSFGEPTLLQLEGLESVPV